MAKCETCKSQGEDRKFGNTCHACDGYDLYQEKYSARDVQNARALRGVTIQGLYNGGLLTREQALELLNAPLGPEEITTYDDRGMLDWGAAQYVAYLTGGGGDGNLSQD